jgi:hypothetical protein
MQIQEQVAGIRNRVTDNDVVDAFRGRLNASRGRAPRSQRTQRWIHRRRDHPERASSDPLFGPGPQARDHVPWKGSGSPARFRSDTGTCRSAARQSSRGEARRRGRRRQTWTVHGCLGLFTREKLQSAFFRWSHLVVSASGVSPSKPGARTVSVGTAGRTMRNLSSMRPVVMTSPSFKETGP